MNTYKTKAYSAVSAKSPLASAPEAMTYPARTTGSLTTPSAIAALEWSQLSDLGNATLFPAEKSRNFKLSQALAERTQTLAFHYQLVSVGMREHCLNLRL